MGPGRHSLFFEIVLDQVPKNQLTESVSPYPQGSSPRKSAIVVEILFVDHVTCTNVVVR